ncbi:Ankyrin repeat domain-containing protein 7 [Fusarium oxysporum f. sp. rapae]|uniref:Ankyrin repeat domain-containing protein 7 n=1 Tax=Fusarium oxysporum f. sp. rapae TaxID=485398 RepID=A0A8J5NNL0_FUSOX|nr:Ankyrin repeat domain-containing protein 7 [Fusarium oxysporum f. sp. rapae]
MLLGTGADPNRIPGLLHYACSTGTLDIVKQLLDDHMDINKFYGDDFLFGTPLQVSVSDNRSDITRFLLKYGADPNITPPGSPRWRPWQRSPLFAAVNKQNSEILAVLLGTGADPNRTPGLLHYACSTGTLDIVKQLLDAHIDINKFYGDDFVFGTPLQVSVSDNRSDITRFLLKYGADPNITSPGSPQWRPWQRSPLFAAVNKQNSEILAVLLDAGADPNRTPGLLSYVAEHNDLDFVKMLVEKGNANVDLMDNVLGTPLQVFAAKGQRDALAYLLDLGADPNIEGGQYGSALNAAITNGHGHCLDELLG